jgi:transketolase
VRGAFVKAVVELAERDERVLLLTGDLGFMALEPFAELFPKRFFNAGVAEQNMVGMATGLAEAGFVPFVYSIATFAALRTYEFVRNGPALHGLPVRIVGVGGGFEYGTAGPTHHALEDAGAMRLLPGLTVISPADHQQTRSALLATHDVPGPIYFRLGKDDRTVVPSLDGRFTLGKVEILGDGRDVVLVTMGGIASQAAAALSSLADQGILATLVVVSTLSPPPEEDLARLLADFSLAVTVEAHSAAGGVGSLVAEVVAEVGLRCRVVRCGVRSDLHGVSGSQKYLEQRHGLSAAAIADAVRRHLR